MGDREMKIFHVAYVGPEGKLVHSIFDEDGLKSWLDQNSKGYNPANIEQAKVGDTFSHAINENFIYWRAQ